MGVQAAGAVPNGSGEVVVDAREEERARQKSPTISVHDSATSKLPPHVNDGCHIGRQVFGSPCYRFTATCRSRYCKLGVISRSLDAAVGMLMDVSECWAYLRTSLLSSSHIGANEVRLNRSVKGGRRGCSNGPRCMH